jgi:hypothetical protein
MGEEQLLQLAQQFLFSDAGKKLIGKDIDLSSLENQIKSEIQSRALEVQSRVNANDVIQKPTLSREERKTARQNERTQNREEREKRIEERRKEREKRAEERRNRGGTVGQFIPEFRAYITSGKVYDQFTKQPLEGVKVQIAIKDPNTGVVIPISGERIEDEEGNIIREVLGMYKILDPILLEELIQYTEDGNFDRLVAAELAIAQALKMNPIIGRVGGDDDARIKSLYKTRVRPALFTSNYSTFSRRKQKLFV